MGEMMEDTTITNYNVIEDDLVIMRQNSSFWYAQYKTDPALKRPNNRVRFSTKVKIGSEESTEYEESYFKAIKVAKAQIAKIKIVGEENHFLSFMNPTVKHLASDLIERYKRHDKDKSRHISILKNRVIPEVGHINIKKFGLCELRQFLDNWKGGKSKTTITILKKVLNDIYVEALTMGVIEYREQPDLKHLDFKAETPNKRKAFTQEDVNIVDDKIAEFITSMANKKSKEYRNIFRLYIIFLRQTGIRAGKEASLLKWKNLYITKHKGNTRVALHISNGKMGSQKKTREIYLNKDTVALLKDLLVAKMDKEERLVWIFEQNNDLEGLFKYFRKRGDEYIFSSINYGKVPDFCDIWQQFRVFLGDDLSESDFTLYCFRHFYITEKLRDEKDKYDIARSTGTSQSMIEKYYDNTCTSLNSEFVEDNLDLDGFKVFNIPQ